MDRSTTSIYWQAAMQSVEMLSSGLPALLLMADALLTAIIIIKVPYTEIDWTAYMEQIRQYLSGQRDYTQIYGGTGPLVYPAAHVYTYTGLYHLTDEGENIFMAQMIFAGLYITTLAVVMGCYLQAKAPLYLFPLLILSKRLHSIFVLRCFNDCFSVFFLFLTIFLYQRRHWTIGTFTYSWGLGTKMSLLVSLPAVGVVLFLGRGFKGSLRQAQLMAQIQVLLALPFLKENWRGYLGRAFELSRQFLFKWTVNWRFVGEDIFLSKPFAIGLLSAHALVLLLFLTTRWLKLTRKPASEIISCILMFKDPLTPQQEMLVSRAVTPRYVMTTILTANVMGLLFARSLHYQFYAYLCWATPFLLWRSGIHPVFQYAFWGAQEWAWNVYPSTPLSSAVAVGVMAITVALVFIGAKSEWEEVPQGEAKSEAAKR